MTPTSRQRRLFTCGAAILLSACGHGGGSDSLFPFPGIHVLAGAGITDTVLSLQRQALVVRVRQGDGSLAQGVVVRFDAMAPADPTRRSEPTVFVCALAAQRCGPYASAFATDTTDSEGRASVMIRLGQVAGRVGVRMSVPELGMVDSTFFTVTPGALAGVRSIARDTGISVGATAMLRGHVVDRFGNARTESTVMAVGAGTAFTLDAARATVTGTAIGTQWLFARYGEMRDSMTVRVIPPARFVAWAAGAHEVRLINSDGTGAARTLAKDIDSGLGAFPRFDATRRSVSMYRADGTNTSVPNTIVVVDTATLARREIGPASGFYALAMVRPQDDGSLMVVGNRTPGGTYALWRVARDNTVSFVVELPDLTNCYDCVDITRDGSKVAYLGLGNLRILTVKTGEWMVLRGNARSPRFSPKGDRIAYLWPGSYSANDGTLVVTGVDGSNDRQFPDYVFSPGISWSPDGVYIVGRNSQYGFSDALRMVRVSDGVNVLMRFSAPTGGRQDYFQPDWR